MPVEQRKAGRWRQRTKERRKHAPRMSSGLKSVKRNASMQTFNWCSASVGRPGNRSHTLLEPETSLDASADLLWKLTTDWRAECQRLACSVRREGRPHPSSLPLSSSGQRSRSRAKATTRLPGVFSDSIALTASRITADRMATLRGKMSVSSSARVALSAILRAYAIAWSEDHLPLRTSALTIPAGTSEAAWRVEFLTRKAASSKTTGGSCAWWPTVPGLLDSRRARVARLQSSRNSARSPERAWLSNQALRGITRWVLPVRR